jgi:cytochrome c biogenesis protein CcmG/thiol:disulfide interchange protein DsbE
MKISVFRIFLISLFIIIFLIFYKGLNNTNIYTPNFNSEKNIPYIENEIFNTNNKINSKEIFKGNKFYLMNIWASWCIPCRDEHPFLMKLSSLKKIEIIGLNYKDKNKNAKNFLKELKNPYKLILSDRDGTNAIEWGAYGVPESFIIHNKKIIKKVIGPIDQDTFLQIKKIVE